ncbi:isomerase [Kitasatospora terrestris]|uniref:Isomerase n=1 Tax=Kitasatospora terrestris TaxID=258051 RepID=A0ABP9ETD8_9ACTN
MPQILIDHSTDVVLDRPAFAAALHEQLAQVIDTTVAECKTVFRPAADHLVGDGGEGRAVVLVEIKILAGRSAELRAELTDRTLALLEAHVRVPAAFGIEVTELDRATYRFSHHAGGPGSS